MHSGRGRRWWGATRRYSSPPNIRTGGSHDARQGGEAGADGGNQALELRKESVIQKSDDGNERNTPPSLDKQGRGGRDERTALLAVRAAVRQTERTIEASSRDHRLLLCDASFRSVSRSLLCPDREDGCWTWILELAALDADGILP